MNRNIETHFRHVLKLHTYVFQSHLPYMFTIEFSSCKMPFVICECVKHNILDSSSIKSSHITQLSSSSASSLSLSLCVCHFPFFVLFISQSAVLHFRLDHRVEEIKMSNLLSCTQTKMCLSARHLLLSCGCDGIFGDTHHNVRHRVCMCVDVCQYLY